MKQSPLQHQPDKQSVPRWRKTQYANLVRYGPSRKYFARVRVGGKLIRCSLSTTVLSVAKLKLGDLEEDERDATEDRTGWDGGKLTVNKSRHRRRCRHRWSELPRSRALPFCCRFCRVSGKSMGSHGRP